MEVGADAAALVYLAHASREGQTESFVALMSSVYRMVDDRPRLVLYQQTAVTRLGETCMAQTSLCRVTCGHAGRPRPEAGNARVRARSAEPARPPTRHHPTRGRTTRPLIRVSAVQGPIVVVDVKGLE